MPRILAASLVVLVACAPGVGDPDAGQEPCTQQTECSTEHKRACVGGLCTRPLEEPRTVAVNVYLGDLARLVGSYRSFVFHPTTPAGGSVKCVAASGKLQGRAEYTGGGADTAAIAAYNGALSDPALFNTTAFPAESNQVPSSGDTFVIPVMLDGGPRTIYLEFYPRRLSAGTPGGEGTPLASACVEGANREDPVGGGVQNIGGTAHEW